MPGHSAGGRQQRGSVPSKTGSGPLNLPLRFAPRCAVLLRFRDCVCPRPPPSENAPRPLGRRTLGHQTSRAESTGRASPESLQSCKVCFISVNSAWIWLSLGLERRPLPATPRPHLQGSPRTQEGGGVGQPWPQAGALDALVPGTEMHPWVVSPLSSSPPPPAHRFRLLELWGCPPYPTRSTPASLCRLSCLPPQRVA